ncbi:MAG: Asp-tRNA(Asn)/Glu-tRNA(Gln) amidotransferase subunit GatC [Planctomycetota bacterium]
MAISRDDVEKVAKLGRLMLTGEELERMTGEMQRILAYVDQLSQAETDGVEPIAHPADVHTVLRDDQVSESLARDQALATAPRHSGEGYLVPAVLGD